MMKKSYMITDEQVVIESEIPFSYINELEINHNKNEHGRLSINAIVRSEYKHLILQTNWSNSKVIVYFKNEKPIPCFSGRIEQVVCQHERGLFMVMIECVGGTIILDRQKKNRSFQDVELTYKQVVKKVIGNYGNAAFIWELGSDKSIKAPIIQYNETDWEFLKRISSHFQSALFSDLKTGMPEFFMGMRQGKQQNINHAKISGWGFDSMYFANGCCENNSPDVQTFYLVVNTKEHWQMGDFLFYKGCKYCVIQRKIFYSSGEFICTYKLGTKGMYLQKKISNKALAGLRLEGTIKGRQEESVYLQLDLDEDEGANYPWAWSPETNNLCYCMPEIGTKAVLYFPTQNEEDGQVILANVNNRENGNCRYPQDKELITSHDNKIGLYNDRLTVDAKNGKAVFTLADVSGIQVYGNLGITLNAVGQIKINAKAISILAPQDIAYKAAASNIEICRDFNFYAPGGVKTVKTVNLPEVKRTRVVDENNKQDCWKFSYQAIGAVPAVDFAAVSSTDELAGIVACGSVPKVAKGSTTVALSEVMEGKKEKEVSFPQAFRSMENFTVKGGYPLPDV